MLGQLDRECAAFGLATTAGTVSATGAAGLTLGGGFGRLGSHFGLACDNLRGADVITANGRLVHTSEKENPELLWGLRGGGGNFGVVTSLEYRLHEMNPVVIGGVWNWPFKEARKVLEFHASFGPTKPDALCTDVLLRSTPGGDAGVSMVVVWSGAASEAEKALAPLRALARTAQGAVGPVPYVQMQSMFDRGFPDGRKYYQKSGLISVLSKGAIDTLLDIFGTPRPQPLVIQFQGLGGAANRVAPDATAFPYRNVLCDAAIITNWENPAESDAYMAAMRAIWARIEPFTNGFYVNSRYEDNLKVFHENYGGNYPRLAKLKRHYDPTNLFRLNANIEPAT